MFRRHSDPTIEAIAQKQRRFFWSAFGLFVFFSLLVAPLEYHFDWYRSLVHHSYQFVIDDFLNPLPKGILYFYAIIVSFEALLFLATYPEIIRNTRIMRGVRVLLWLPIVVFFFEYFVSGNYPAESHEQHIPIVALYLQGMTAIVALLLSLITHTVSLKFEAKRQS